jgi:tetratricopeptide (TPR) repeat protein
VLSRSFLTTKHIVVQQKKEGHGQEYSCRYSVEIRIRRAFTMFLQSDSAGRNIPCILLGSSIYPGVFAKDGTVYLRRETEGRSGRGKRMRKRSVLFAALLLLGSIDGWCQAVVPGGGSENCVERIDTLLEKGKQENYQSSGLDLMKESLDRCLACMEKRPEDYEILWRCARAAHQYGETARNLQVEGWEEICQEWGRKGTEIAEKAMAVEPDRVEGYFWQGACIGVYSDGTGIMTAVKEGFYKKSKSAMARVYELDKTYNDYDSVFANAMFWISLPFPLKSKQKALEYYREFEESTAWKERPYIRRVYGANLLMEVKPRGYKEEAKRLLDKALGYPHLQKYYRDWATELRSDLK